MTIGKIMTCCGALVLIFNAGSAIAETTPLPREKPQIQSKVETGKPAQEQKKLPDLNSADSFGACITALKAAGVSFSQPDPVTSERQGCGISRPVQLSAVSSPAGPIELPGTPVLNCTFAKRFAAWVAQVAAPMVKGTTGRTLTAINTGPGYQCRNRNRAKNGKVSEHAIGNAIDIANFIVDGGRLETANRAKGNPNQRRLLSALSTSACGYFTTVLGPGSNTAHESHFHFDYQKRGKGWNYRICQ